MSWKFRYLFIVTTLALVAQLGFGDDERVQKAAQPITNSIGMKLVPIPAGAFLMGSSPTEIDEMARLDSRFPRIYGEYEQPQHRVQLTKPFYVGQCEVTRAEFARFVTETNYQTDAEHNGDEPGAVNKAKGNFDIRKPAFTWRKTHFPQDDSHPVIDVSWNDAVAFCEWLTQKEGKEYRLPTEAEWEYACRAGTTSLWSHGNDLAGLLRSANVAYAIRGHNAWRSTSTSSPLSDLPDDSYLNARDGYLFTAPVARFQPNKWDLYDMHGNVLEWCADWYDPEAYLGRTGATADPFVETASEDRRVVRGGSFVNPSYCARAAYRNGLPPDSHYSIIGFRVARTQ